MSDTFSIFSIRALKAFACPKCSRKYKSPYLSYKKGGGTGRKFVSCPCGTDIVANFDAEGLPYIEGVYPITLDILIRIEEANM